MLKQLLAAIAALTLAAPLAAQAQEVPSYADVQTDQQIQGRITAFDGAYDLTVADDNGYTDNVELHDGTIINPTGLTLAPGMIVNVLGYNAGQAFEANEVDTPYTFDAGIPYYAGHPWNYYGPTIGLSFFFGNTGWWHRPGGFVAYGHGGYARGGYSGYDRGNDRGVAYGGETRVNNVTVRNNYNTNNYTASQPRAYNVQPHAFNAQQPVRSTYSPPQPVRSFGGGAQFGGLRDTHASAPAHDRR